MTILASRLFITVRTQWLSSFVCCFSVTVRDTQQTAAAEQSSYCYMCRSTHCRHTADCCCRTKQLLLHVLLHTLQTHSRLLLQNKAATVTCVAPHTADTQQTAAVEQSSYCYMCCSTHCRHTADCCCRTKQLLLHVLLHTLQIHSRLLLQNKAATVTYVAPHTLLAR